MEPPDASNRPPFASNVTSKRLGVRTDSSAKYEKGLDPNNCEEAINRACELVELFGCGEVIGGVIDVKTELPEEYKKYEELRKTDPRAADMKLRELTGKVRKQKQQKRK